MSRRRERIDTRPAQGELNSAFANLDLPDLQNAPPPPESLADQGSAAHSKRKLGRVVLRREKAHRGGKTVIVVHDFAPDILPAQIDDFARKLRTACGCGGTVRDRTIEIQGDQPGRIRALLVEQGFRVTGVE